MRAPWVRDSERDFTRGRQVAWPPQSPIRTFFFGARFLLKFRAPSGPHTHSAHPRLSCFWRFRIARRKSPPAARRPHRSGRANHHTWVRGSGFGAWFGGGVRRSGVPHPALRLRPRPSHAHARARTRDLFRVRIRRVALTNGTFVAAKGSTTSTTAKTANRGSPRQSEAG